jgi:hypothetical protein
MTILRSGVVFDGKCNTAKHGQPARSLFFAVFATRSLLTVVDRRDLAMY